MLSTLALRYCPKAVSRGSGRPMQTMQAMQNIEYAGTDAVRSEALSPSAGRSSCLSSCATQGLIRSRREVIKNRVTELVIKLRNPLDSAWLGFVHEGLLPPAEE